jgi:preprotein translocase subunit SecE
VDDHHRARVRHRQRAGCAGQVAQELELVSWPNLRETRASTVAVVVFTFVAAFTLGVFDLVWSRLSALVY